MFANPTPLAIEGKSAGFDVFLLRRLAVEAQVCEPTARAWLLGTVVQPSSHTRLSAAAERLGLRVKRKTHTGRPRGAR
jgi:hypothetical protein